ATCAVWSPESSGAGDTDIGTLRTATNKEARLPHGSNAPLRASAQRNDRVTVRLHTGDSASPAAPTGLTALYGRAEAVDRGSGLGASGTSAGTRRYDRWRGRSGPARSASAW